MADKLREGIDKLVNKKEPESVFGEPLYDSLKGEDKFRYQLLDRLRGDLDYYLGHGIYNENNLWNSDKKPETTVKYMKSLYDSFVDKPEWLTADQIRDYEKRLGEPIQYNPDTHDYFKNYIKETPNGIKRYREQYKDNDRLQQLLNIIENMK